MVPDDIRLRTAFLLSIADVFFGAIGVLVILIVLSANRSETRILEAYDLRATCTGSDEASFRLTPALAAGPVPPLDKTAWLASLPEDRFMFRVAIRPEGADASCYLLAREIAARHNAALETRGAVQAVLAVEYWTAPALSGAASGASQ